MIPDFYHVFCHDAFVAPSDKGRPYAKVNGEFWTAPVAYKAADGTVVPSTGDASRWAFCLPHGTAIVVPKLAADGRFLGGSVYRRAAGESVVFIDFYPA